MKLILQAIKALIRKQEKLMSNILNFTVEKTVLVKEQTVTINEPEYEYDGLSEQISDATSLKVGKNYFVNFNGTVYECVAYWYPALEAVCIGNPVIIGASTGIGGNGEPFCIDNYSDGEAYLNTNEAGDYTVSITSEVSLSEKLDSKYVSIDKLGNTYTVEIIGIKRNGAIAWTMNKGTYEEIKERILNHKYIQFNVVCYDNPYLEPMTAFYCLYNEEDETIDFYIKFKLNDTTYRMYINSSDRVSCDYN